MKGGRGNFTHFSHLQPQSKPLKRSPRLGLRRWDGNFDCHLSVKRWAHVMYCLFFCISYISQEITNLDIKLWIWIRYCIYPVIEVTCS